MFANWTSYQVLTDTSTFSYVIEIMLCSQQGSVSTFCYILAKILCKK